jgi:hypothetical protein
VLGDKFAIDSRQELIKVLERDIVQLANIDGTKAVEVGASRLVEELVEVLVMGGGGVGRAGKVVEGSRRDDGLGSTQYKQLDSPPLNSLSSRPSYATSCCTMLVPPALEYQRNPHTIYEDLPLALHGNARDITSKVGDIVLNPLESSTLVQQPKILDPGLVRFRA